MVDNSKQEEADRASEEAEKRGMKVDLNETLSP